MVESPTKAGVVSNSNSSSGSTAIKISDAVTIGVREEVGGRAREGVLVAVATADMV